MVTKVDLIQTFLCRLSDLEEAKPRLVRAGGRRLAVIKIAEEIFALDPPCPHRGGPLHEGEVSVDRHEITCPWHRFRFSLRDGACVAATSRKPATVFRVFLKGDDVFAELPRPS